MCLVAILSVFTSLYFGGRISPRAKEVVTRITESSYCRIVYLAYVHVMRKTSAPAAPPKKYFNNVQHRSSGMAQAVVTQWVKIRVLREERLPEPDRVLSVCCSLAPEPCK